MSRSVRSMAYPINLPFFLFSFLFFICPYVSFTIPLTIFAETLEEDGEDEEMPEDLASLSPEEQQSRIKQRAAYFMLVGTAIVMVRKKERMRK